MVATLRLPVSPELIRFRRDGASQLPHMSGRSGRKTRLTSTRHRAEHGKKLWLSKLELYNF
jgi:hypothetical protein